MREDVETVVFPLESLWWLINRGKYCLVPSQVKPFLGYLVDSRTQQLLLTQEKVENIVTAVGALYVPGRTS